ncbi:MAG: FAD-binding protein [Rhodospirillales bacterium]|nr:FAD-binding protein [Rhodospirillales bacterium]
MDTSARKYGRVDDAFVGELAAIVGKDKVSTSDSVCQQHGQDESYHPNMPPDVVIFPQSTEQVSAVVKACAAKSIPVIPFGAGTSLEGHVAATHGGVSIDLSEMNAILEVHNEDLDVVVQPGVRRMQLNAHLRDTGLFFPVDPGADASIGGMVATRASGTNTVRYGAMRENVMALQVVLADGRIIRTSSRAKKSAAGYDLTHLFIGSEGTLGVITEITLKLYGIPEAVSSAVCPFPSVDNAVNTVIATIQSGVPVARIEFLDDASMDSVNSYSKLNYTVAPTLFFEFHGSEAGVAEQAEMVSEIAAEYGGTNFQWATKQEDRDRLWHARHNAYYAARSRHPGTKGVIGDACVPISRLAEAITTAKKDMDQTPIPTYIVGHVGDGNFHTLYMIDPDDPSQEKEAKKSVERTVKMAISMGGTCTGEHGVGMGKIDYLRDEHGDAIDVMSSIKVALDPLNIMNPDKVVLV